jgi:hypothetical protein
MENKGGKITFKKNVGGGGRGKKMSQALYANMNDKTIKKSHPSCNNQPPALKDFLKRI